MVTDASRSTMPERTSSRAAVLLVIVGFSCVGFCMLNFMHAMEPLADLPQAGQSEQPGSRLFRLWPRERNPDVVLVLTGEMFGFIQPCGCSSPQYGGLERRYNLIQNLVKERRWPVVAIDLGDIAQKSGPQTLAKYVYSMKALNKMDYTATSIGRNEMALPLIDALSEYALNNPTPRVLSANISKREENFPDMLKTAAVASPQNGPRVGVAAVVSPTIAKDVRDDMVKFDAVENSLPAAIGELQKQKSELNVLLFQGSFDEAKKVAEKFPQFHIILCVSAEDEPPEKADRAGNSLVVRVGHKGRCLGLVGVYRTNQAEVPYELHYQMAQLGPEYETPAGQEPNNPILAILEDYAGHVKKTNYIAEYPRTQHPIQRAFPGAEYVGSDKCKRCHEESYKVWKESAHSHAFDALVKATKPSQRQFDGECIGCHVVGFGITKGFADEKSTPHLLHVGCESCHGPGSVHVKAMAASQPNPPELAKLMNPLRTPDNETAEAREKRMRMLNDSCQKCHDPDNDVHWNIKKWDKIVHKEPDIRAPK